MIWQRFTAEATATIARDQPPAGVPSAGIPQLLQGVLARATEGELNEESSVPGNEESAIGGCDIAACSRAYRSFRAEDCTYQPYDGPRQLCTRGSPGETTDSATIADTAPPRHARKRTMRPTVRRLLRVFGLH
jgi:hypothetical protein